jgi:inorganic pyrophosphatase
MRIAVIRHSSPPREDPIIPPIIPSIIPSMIPSMIPFKIPFKMPRLIRTRTPARLFGTLMVPTLLCIAAVGPAEAQDTVRPDVGAGCEPGGQGPTTGALAGLAQPLAAPDELLALVEIPAGSAIKYELHLPSGRMEVDRFLAMPMAYPANYGILPCTRGGDGDALDVLVLTRAPLLPGSVIRVRAVGVLRMIDRGEEDDKILAVPLDAVDATFAPIRALEDLVTAERSRIEAFFRVYKNLPDPTVQVEVGPWLGREAALEMIREALARS